MRVCVKCKLIDAELAVDSVCPIGESGEHSFRAAPVIDWQAKYEKAEAACAAMREALERVAKSARQSTGLDSTWIDAALATDAGTALLARLKDAEAVVAAARKYATRSGVHPNAQPEVHAARDELLHVLGWIPLADPARTERDALDAVAAERDTARAERDSLLKTTETRLAAAEALYAAACADDAMGGREGTNARLLRALAAYEQTRAVRP